MFRKPLLISRKLLIKLKYIHFWGHQPAASGIINQSCLSQWWNASFDADGQQYPTAEHYMMAGKAKLFNDYETLEEILKSETSNQAKSLGRKVKNFDPQLWDEQKYEIVKQGNLLKFSQNEEFKEFLLSTNDKVLVEASPYDTIWGIGMLETDQKAKNPVLWNGENLLGFALMEVRDLLKR
ncbi:MAG: NADAR family protein [Flavobacterium sp.]|nr:MAG: NADAR family protein [Flavobacterium sp.]